VASEVTEEIHRAKRPGVKEVVEEGEERRCGASVGGGAQISRCRLVTALQLKIHSLLGA